MAKKRLTDLLREEAGKSPESQGETDPDDHLSEPMIDPDPEAVEESAMNTRSRTNAKNSTPTKAELEATVTELKTALAEANQDDSGVMELKEALAAATQTEKALQQQIGDLQADLKQQRQSVENLQNDLEKLSQLKTDFEQAKKAAVQLAKANESLTQEIEALKKENESLKTKSPQKAKSPQPTQSALSRPIQKESEKPADFAKSAWLL